MAVLLMARHIDVDKQVNKDGLFALSIDKADFASAVEILRLHGYPQKKYRNVEDIFPSDQLVTSPGQELSKIIYLKEQGLERMLADMDGVISTRVVIAQPLTTDDESDKSMTSVAVFIKYSPEHNLQSSLTQIKGLVHDSIPDLGYDKISIVLQPIQYIKTDVTSAARNSLKDWIKLYGFWMVACAVGCAWIIFLSLVIYGKYKQRRTAEFEE